MEKQLSITSQFVPYDLAVKLKELGFDEKCFTYYSSHCKLGFKLNGFVNNSWLFNESPVNDTKTYAQVFDAACSAPLWQQAFDWFFKHNKLFQYVRILNKKDFGFSIFTYYDDLGKALVYSSNYYKTYEEARLACLEKLIELA